jgi:hypothetical protein
MKKRLLLILVISVSFAPAVWANSLDGFDDFGTFKRPNEPIQIDCEAGGVSRMKHYASEDKPVAIQKADSGIDTSGVASSD